MSDSLSKMDALGKPPVTCYAPAKGKVHHDHSQTTKETFTKGSDDSGSPAAAKGKTPTATCYMPVGDYDPYSAGGSQAKGLTPQQVENRMKLIDGRNKE